MFDLVLLVPIRVMDELPMELLGLLCVELLTTVRALERTLHPDAHIDNSAIARLRTSADLHVLSAHLDKGSTCLKEEGGCKKL